MAVVEGDERGHAVRLLRSHAGGMGEPLAEEVVRGRSWFASRSWRRAAVAVDPNWPTRSPGCWTRTTLPVLHDLGGLGTGDLTSSASSASRCSDPKRV